MNIRDWQNFPDKKPEEERTVLIRAKRLCGKSFQYAVGVFYNGKFRFDNFYCPECGREADFRALQYNYLEIGQGVRRPIIYWIYLDSLLEKYNGNSRLAKSG